MDFQDQFVRNSKLFKENLKLITCSLIDVLWKEKIDSPQTADILKSLERKEQRGFEEIREESEENEQCSPAPSGSNTDRIFSDPLTDEDKRQTRSPKFNPVDLKFDMGLASVEETDFGRPSQSKASKAKLKPEKIPKRPLSPKATFKRPIFRRSQSNEDARKLQKALCGDDNDNKSRPLGTTLRFLGQPKVFKASLRTRDITVDSVHSNLHSLRSGMDALDSAKHLDTESTDRTRGKKNNSTKQLSKGEKFWRQVLKFEASRASNLADLTRSGTVFGFEKVGKSRISKANLERSVTELGKAGGDFGSNASSVTDTTRDKRHLTFGRTNLANLQPFLKNKSRPQVSSISRWEDLELLKKAGKKLSLEISHASSEGDRTTIV